MLRLINSILLETNNGSSIVIGVAVVALILITSYWWIRWFIQWVLLPFRLRDIRNLLKEAVDLNIKENNLLEEILEKMPDPHKQSDNRSDE